MINIGALIRLLLPLAFAAAIIAGILNAPVIEKKDQEIRVPDVIAYYSASQLCSGDCNDAYDAKEVLNIERPILQKYNVSNPRDDILTFLYPPSALFFFLPLRHLNFEQAYYSVLAFNILLTAIILWQLKAFSRHWRGWHFTAFASLIVLFPAWHQVMLTGQVSLLLLSLLLVFFRFFILQNGHNSSRAIISIAGISWFKPHLILYHLGALLAWRKWKELAVFALLSLLMMGMIWLCFGNIISSFVSMLLHAGNDHQSLGANVHSMINNRALLLLFLEYSNLTLVNYLAFGLYVVIFLLSLYWCKRIQFHENKAIGYSLIILANLFFSPWLHRHDFILAVPVLWSLYEQMKKEKSECILFWAIMMSYTALLWWMENNILVWMLFEWTLAWMCGRLLRKPASQTLIK